MKVDDSVTIMKALADNSRLFILNTLLEKPQYVEEIAKRLDLAASTVSFHLKKLENAGLVRKTKEQYYIIYSLNKSLFGKTLKEIIRFDNVEEEAQQTRIDTYKQKVLNTFFKDGKLQQIPKQYKKRWIILENFIQDFSQNKVYDEKEVDAIIEKKYHDYCSIRRYLVDEKIFSRSKGKYMLNQKRVVSGRIKTAFEDSIMAK